MKILHYNESKERGIFGFPMEIYHVNEAHLQYIMDLHWHIEYEMIHILSGKFYLTLDNKKYILKQGDTAFISSGTLHTGTPKDCIYDCLVFDINMLSKKNSAFQQEIDDIIDQTIEVDNFFPREDEEFSYIIKSLFSAIRAKEKGYQLIAQGALYQLIGIIKKNKYYIKKTTQTTKANRKSKQIKQAIQFIEKNYEKYLTLEQIAKSAEMSPNYFCGFFREMTRRTPIDYLNYYRIENACFYLLNTKYKVTEIAYMCGFDDLSYFIRVFKKYKHITPKQYVVNYKKEHP